MERTKTTKKALGSSIFALFMCVMMLIGTTFAWFTDTASTAVNKIQAGTLDVVLEMEDAEGNWSDAAGKTLTWKANDNRDQDKILWEPGCTYELQSVRVRNNGNLDLKYKIVISGINGSAKLNDAIEWTISDTELDSNHSLLAGNTSEALTIKGHMKESAGNEYQGLSIDGIAITVYATQLNSEYDSYGNTYDVTATYDLKINESMTETLSVNQTEGQAPTVASQTTVSSGAVSVTYPEGVVLKSDTTVEGTTDKTATVKQSLEYTGNTVSEDMSSVSIGEDKSVASYKLELPVAEDNTKLIPITINYEKYMSGLEVYHSGKKLATSAASAGANAHEYFTYESNTGKLTLYLFHASSIDILYDDNFEARIGSVPYTTIEKAVSAAEDNEIVTLLKNVELTSALIIKKSITLDTNGKTITADKVKAPTDYNASGVVMFDGSSVNAKIIGTGAIKNTYAKDCLLSCVMATNGAKVEVGGINVKLNGSSDNIVLYVYESGEMTIKSGSYLAIGGGTCVAAYGKNAKIEITGGDFDTKGDGGPGCVWSTHSATINIHGGTFHADALTRQPLKQGETLNAVYCLYNYKDLENDNRYKSYVGNLTVYGGTFKGFNPAGGNIGVDTNFLAEGYKSTESNGTWTVTKDS